MQTRQVYVGDELMDGVVLPQADGVQLGISSGLMTPA